MKKLFICLILFLLSFNIVFAQIDTCGNINSNNKSLDSNNRGLWGPDPNQIGSGCKDPRSIVIVIIKAALFLLFIILVVPLFIIGIVKLIRSKKNPVKIKKAKKLLIIDSIILALLFAVFFAGKYIINYIYTHNF